MKIVVFGLTISSSWGNGHATLWRALCSALAERGHNVVFFERDVEYYASTRDLLTLPGGELILYDAMANVSRSAREHLDSADLAMVTSYCPDGPRASDLVLHSRAGVRAFYDLDTPVTLRALEAGEQIEYLPSYGLKDFDLVLSYTGGDALSQLQRRLGARCVAPLYGSVDAHAHFPVPPVPELRCELSYLGTYAADRQASLLQFFIEPARQRPEQRFLIGGAQYPADFPWTANLHFMRHVPPDLHPAFFCSSRATLNITRQAMASFGYCPSGRLFEAAACGVPLLTDTWQGLDQFFTPGSEVLPVKCAQDVLNAMDRSDEELSAIAKAARERTLAEHTSARRAAQLEALMEQLKQPVAESRVIEAGAPAQIRSSRKARRDVWGIIPAAGVGSRIQPLAFSKELLPVGSRIEGETERPRAVSEYIMERMVAGGANKLCFVISPGKSDILEYYASGVAGAEIVYTVQPKPGGLCDAIFHALPVISPDSQVLVGLPDTLWFPSDALAKLPDDCLSFLLFPVEHPEFFDAVVTRADGEVTAIDVKSRNARSNWVWGAFKMPGCLLHELHALWRQPERGDEYIGTLVNAYLAAGGTAKAVLAGESYVDVGTLHGYREAMGLLNERGDGSAPLQRPQPHTSVPTNVGHSAGGELHDADIARIA